MLIVHERFQVYEIKVNRLGKRPKFYIGYTRDLDARWASHKQGRSNQGNPSLVSYSVEKYGVDALEFRVLHSYANEGEARASERRLIEWFQLDRSRWPDGNGLNLCPGGGGGSAGTPIYSYDGSTGEFLARYQSAKEAAQSLRVSESSIRSALNGRLRVSHKRTWLRERLDCVEPRAITVKRAVISTDPKTKKEAHYASVTEAQETVGLKSINPGLRYGKVCGGLLWRYADQHSDSEKTIKARSIPVYLIDGNGHTTLHDSMTLAATFLGCCMNSVRGAIQYEGITNRHRAIKVVDLDALNTGRRKALINQVADSIRIGESGGNRCRIRFRTKPCVLISQVGEVSRFDSVKSAVRFLGVKARNLPKPGKLGRIKGCTFVSTGWFDSLSQPEQAAVINDAMDYRPPGKVVGAVVAVNNEGVYTSYDSTKYAADCIGGQAWEISFAAKHGNNYKGYKLATKERFDGMSARERADFLFVGPRSRSILSIDPANGMEIRYDSIMAAVKASGIVDVGLAASERGMRAGQLWRREYLGVNSQKGPKKRQIYLIDAQSTLALFVSASDAALELGVVNSRIAGGIRSSGKIMGHRAMYASDLDVLAPPERTTRIAEMVASLNLQNKEKPPKQAVRVTCVCINGQGEITRYESVSAARHAIGAIGALVSVNNKKGVITKGHRLISAAQFDRLSIDEREALIAETVSYRVQGGVITVTDRQGNITEYKSQMEAGAELGVSHGTVGQAISLNGIIGKSYKACFKTDYENMTVCEREIFHTFQSRPTNSRSKPAVLITSKGVLGHYSSCKEAGKHVGIDPSSAAHAARAGVVKKECAIFLLSDFNQLTQELGVKEGSPNLMLAALEWKKKQLDAD